MRQRILVAIVGLPILAVPIYLGGIWIALLFLVLALVGGYELYHLLEVGGYRPARWLGLVWLTCLMLTGWPSFPFSLGLVVTAGTIILLTYCLFLHEQPISTWAATTAGAVYLGVMASEGLALRLLPSGLWWLLFAVLITWANDTAAYFVGLTLGRRRLWPRLSPKKTWEGTVGGWLAATLGGGLLALWMPLPFGFLGGALLGFASGVLALFGDLSVSMLKRQVGIKDTSHLFPGHGGMLDRLDSILFVVPFIYQVVIFFGW